MKKIYQKRNELFINFEKPINLSLNYNETQKRLLKILSNDTQSSKF